MKSLLFLSVLLVSFPLAGYAQKSSVPHAKWLVEKPQLNLKTAIELAHRVRAKAHAMGKEISLAIVGNQGETILVMKGDEVGVHNTEAARRKAFTALSTKISTLTLLRSANKNPDSHNLNSLPELLLLSGGVPIWKDNYVIGAVGVAGGGSAENDEMIAKAASLPEAGIMAK